MIYFVIEIPTSKWSPEIHNFLHWEIDEKSWEFFGNNNKTYRVRFQNDKDALAFKLKFGLNYRE